MDSVEGVSVTAVILVPGACHPRCEPDSMTPDHQDHRDQWDQRGVPPRLDLELQYITFATFSGNEKPKSSKNLRKMNVFGSEPLKT